MKAVQLMINATAVNVQFVPTGDVTAVKGYQPSSEREFDLALIFDLDKNPDRALDEFLVGLRGKLKSLIQGGVW